MQKHMNTKETLKPELLHNKDLSKIFKITTMEFSPPIIDPKISPTELGDPKANSKYKKRILHIEIGQQQQLPKLVLHNRTLHEHMTRKGGSCM